MHETKTVVLVHGIWMSPLFVSFLGRALRSRGYRVHYFSYWPTLRPFSQCLADFQYFVQRLPVTQFHLVGHSLGGKLIWQWINDYQVAPLGRVVTLGSPHRGSVVAEALLRHRWGAWLLGQASEPLCYDQRAVPAGWQWGALAGSAPLGLGRLVYRSSSVCDGSVEAAETQLEGACDQRILPQSHFGMLLSAPFVREIDCFLRHARFC